MKSFVRDESAIAYGVTVVFLAMALFSLVWIGLSVGVNEVGDSFNNNMIPDLPISQQTVDTTSGLINMWVVAPVFVILSIFGWAVVRALEKKEGGG